MKKNMFTAGLFLLLLVLGACNSRFDIKETVEDRLNPRVLSSLNAEPALSTPGTPPDLDIPFNPKVKNYDMELRYSTSVSGHMKITATSKNPEHTVTIRGLEPEVTDTGHAEALFPFGSSSGEVKISIEVSYKGKSSVYNLKVRKAPY